MKKNIGRPKTKHLSEEIKHLKGEIASLEGHCDNLLATINEHQRRCTDLSIQVTDAHKYLDQVISERNHAHWLLYKSMQNRKDAT